MTRVVLLCLICLAATALVAQRMWLRRAIDRYVANRAKAIAPVRMTWDNGLDRGDFVGWPLPIPDDFDVPYKLEPAA